MEISEFQQKMRDLYIHNDKKRGIYRTCLWLGEEMGELMSELKYSIDLYSGLVNRTSVIDILLLEQSLMEKLKITTIDYALSTCSEIELGTFESTIPDERTLKYKVSVEVSWNTNEASTINNSEAITKQFDLTFKIIKE